MENSLQSTERIDWISKAKGFGILGIVAVHTVQKFDIAFVSSVAYAGMFCVQLFFIISAYLTFKSLDKKDEGWNIKSYFKYLLHKLFRLMPVLYTSCLWHLIMHCIEIHGIPNVGDSVWRKGLFAVTFLNGFSYHYINPWMNWYVGDLVIFLALAPLLKKLIDTPKKSVILFTVSIFVGSLSTYILAKAGVDTGWYFYFWFPRQFPVLAAGIVFFFLEKNKHDEQIKNTFFTFVFVVAFGFLISKSWKPILENHVQYGILLLAFTYTLFYKFDTRNLFNWLKMLGDNSYGIYLYHGCLLPIIGGLINKIDFSRSSYSFIICYISVLCLSLLISKIVNFVIEKPFWNFTKLKLSI